MASRVSSPEDAGCFCFNLDSGLTRALPKERIKRALCPLYYCTTGNRLAERVVTLTSLIVEITTIMNYSYEENKKIIEKWRERATKDGDGDISPDGVYYKGKLYLEPNSNQMWRYTGEEDEQWAKAKRRILFVSKDMNESNNAYDFRCLDLTHNPDGSLSFGCRFNNNLLRITTGISLLTKEGYPTYDEVNDIEYVNKVWKDTAIARINLKKHSGGSSCPNNILRESIDKYQDLILEQMKLLAPNIIVCCGGSGIIKDFVIEKFLEEKPEDLKSETDNWIYYSPNSDVWVIDSYHMNPMGHSTDQDLYENIMKYLQDGMKKHNTKI